MVRFLLILLLAYLLYRIVRLFVRFLLFRPKSNSENFSDVPPEKPGKRKIINKDEGEYVPFEEIEPKDQ